MRHTTDLSAQTKEITAKSRVKVFTLTRLSFLALRLVLMQNYEKLPLILQSTVLGDGGGKVGHRIFYHFGAGQVDSGNAQAV